MKKNKLIITTLALGVLPLVCPLNGQAEESSTATLNVTAGALEFAESVSDTAAINFTDVKLNGKDVTVSEKGESYVALNDYRGASNNWQLRVKEAGTLGFKNNNLKLNFTPTLDGIAKSAIAISDTETLVAEGGQLEHTVKLAPTLFVPKEALAKSYETTLAWTLSPSGDL